MQNTKIEWARHTFNPWRGCTRVSPGCAHCYAEILSHRNPKTLGVWGPQGTRVVAAESAWREPLKWDREAAALGERHRVFCASLADVFEGPETLPRDSVPIVADARERLFHLVRQTPNLNWLLLTKRPQNVRPILEKSKRGLTQPYEPDELADWCYDWFNGRAPSNVWIGTSVENQATADERIPHLLQVPAAVRFLSCEPLLEDLGKIDTSGIQWVIVGGESGPHARPCELAWVRALIEQCHEADTPCFVKQLGSNLRGLTRHGLDHDHLAAALGSTYRLRDPKGGDPDEWPEDLRVRQCPRRDRVV